MNPVKYLWMSGYQVQFINPEATSIKHAAIPIHCENLMRKYTSVVLLTAPSYTNVLLPSKAGNLLISGNKK